MLFFVTGQTRAFDTDLYRIITVEESLQLMKDCKVLQYDCETTGLDPRLGKLLCIQFGNKKKDFQIVIDCNTVNILLYKDILENILLVGQNLKFDIQWLFNYGIIPKKVYDTMIVEQLLYLGYPKGVISYSLAQIAYRRLGIYIDKTIRETIGESLTDDIIVYAGHDVEYLEDIMQSQLKDCREKNCMNGAKLECDVVPVIAYLEWCGIKLDAEKWKSKMAKDSENLKKAKKELDDFLIRTCSNDYLSVPKDYYDTVEIDLSPLNSSNIDKELKKKNFYLRLGYILKSDNFGRQILKSTVKIRDIIDIKKKFVVVNNQGDLFEGFNTDPVCVINWSSSKQVILVAKALGFNTTVSDHNTGEDKDSVLEKVLKIQKGINDEFLDLYFKYQEYAKVCTTYGQGHLNMINPKTGRCHTLYHQLGASSSRMSCGSNKPNYDLAKILKINPKNCTYCNMQQLPHDAETRSCFISEKDNLFCSCDYSSQEGRTQAEIYNERVLIDMYNNNLDSHSVNAKIFFKEELKDIDVKDVKKLRPDLRQAAKAPFFALSYGGDYTTLMSSLGIDEATAKSIVQNYQEGYKDTMEYAKKGSNFVRKNGYILINPYFGHRLNWYGYEEWKDVQNSFTSEFWEEYRARHKGTGDSIAQMVRESFKTASKYDRLARNAPSQGSSSIMTKLALIDLFKWIVENNYFGKVLIVNVTHDEINTEFPKELQDSYPKLVQDIMSKAGKFICKKVDVPAEASVGNCWIH